MLLMWVGLTVAVEIVARAFSLTLVALLSATIF
jgi:hypothetical protein